MYFVIHVHFNIKLFIKHVLFEVFAIFTSFIFIYFLFQAFVATIVSVIRAVVSMIVDASTTTGDVADTVIFFLCSLFCFHISLVL